MCAVRSLLKIALLAFACLTAYGQGTVNFANIGVGLNAPFFLNDGITPLSGPQYMAELLGASSPINLVPIATTSFLTGTSAGYFLDGVQTIPDVPAGWVAWVEVLVWNAANGVSFAEAKASGLGNSWYQSAVFSVNTGGDAGSPPLTPGTLTGLGQGPLLLNVPEPGTVSLLGLGGLLFLLIGGRR